ncbi:sensor domain-containing diguanylate cyclase [Chitinimonas lacunae]|uniref:diguanylate cyclase n=1 Tax=Chitinimonas lacunae TaxID=1963018 RepID=A0ABV8MW92_9NEIS
MLAVTGSARLRALFICAGLLMVLVALWLWRDWSQLGAQQARTSTAQLAAQQLDELPQAWRLAAPDLAARLHRLDALLADSPAQQARLRPLMQAPSTPLNATHQAQLEVLRIEQARSRQQEELRLAAAGRQLALAGAVALGLALLLLLLLHFHLAEARRQQLRHRQTIERHNEDLSQLLAEVGRHNRSLGALAELARFLQSCVSHDETAQLLRHFLPRLFRLDAGALYLPGRSHDQLERRVQWGEGEQALLVEVDQCWALRRAQPYRPGDGSDRLVCGHADEGDYLCLPLLGRGEVLGLLHLIGPPQGDDQRFEQRLAELAAELVALSILTQRLQNRLREQAIRDPLTNLYNRRYFEEAAEHELLRAARRRRDGLDTHLTLVRLDIDQFKRLNDRYGHDAGDLVLRETARLIREQLRQSDLVSRFIDEAFAILLPDSPLDDTVCRAETLRRAILRNRLQHNGALLPEINVSLGVAAYGQHGDELALLLQRAEQALHGARQVGGTRVAVAGPVDRA